MSRIVSVSVEEVDFFFIKDKKLSPTEIFRHAIDRIRNKLGDGFYSGQQKELEDKLQKLNDRFMDANEFINLHGLGEQYVVHIQKQEDKQRRIRAAEQKNDVGSGPDRGLPPSGGQSRDEYIQT